MKLLKRQLLLFTLSLIHLVCHAQQNDFFTPGTEWLDNQGEHINAHGGGILTYNDTYYWFGEHRPTEGFITEEGIICYSSKDLYNWTNQGIVLAVSSDEASPIVKGCIMERPKVIHNKKTNQFVLYFHLELKGRGYEAAQVGVAVSDNITGPFEFVKASRVNPGKWPLNMTLYEIDYPLNPDDYKDWWTPKWYDAVKKGLFVHRDFKGGQMSRDMTLFVDDDDKAYHIYSSEDNLTLHIAELTDDYLDYTGRYIRIDPTGHNEAPALFKHNGKYYMITSGCTGWDPNEGRLLVADSILGDWKRLGNPFKGVDSNLSFKSQSTCVFPLIGRENSFIYMGDRWTPTSLSNSRHIWLPIQFENDLPIVRWYSKWTIEEHFTYY